MLFFDIFEHYMNNCPCRNLFFEYISYCDNDILCSVCYFCFLPSFCRSLLGWTDPLEFKSITLENLATMGFKSGHVNTWKKSFPGVS
jgi:hypothetical protein